jgi:prophage regulatory protein
MVKPIGRNQQMARSRTSQVDEPPLNRSGNEAGQPSDGDTEMQSSPSNGSYAKGAPVAFPEDELWSFKTVVARTGLSRSSIYSYIAQGLFPRQRRLGLRRVGWLASEVRAWISSRPI